MMGLNYISSPLYSVVTNVISQPGPDLSVSACVQGWSIVFLIRFIGGEGGGGHYWGIFCLFLVYLGNCFDLKYMEEFSQYLIGKKRLYWKNIQPRACVSVVVLAVSVSACSVLKVCLVWTTVFPASSVATWMS